LGIITLLTSIIGCLIELEFINSDENQARSADELQNKPPPNNQNPPTQTVLPPREGTPQNPPNTPVEHESDIIPAAPPGGKQQALPPLGGQHFNKQGTVSLGAGITINEPPAETRDSSTSALCPDCDVIVISVCSLRKDYVGAYGLSPSPTPSIDTLAEGGFVFERTFAASNFTLASLTAMLTGYFGASTGVTGWDKGLTKALPTLPEVLGFYGFKTAAFTIDAASGFRPDYGLHRGFQRMELTPAPRSTPDGRYQTSQESIEGDGASAIPVVNWLAEQGTEKPVFLMFHDRTAHYPFVVSEKGVEEDKTGVTKVLWEAGHQDANREDTELVMPGMAGGTKHKGIVNINGEDPVHALLRDGGDEAMKIYRGHYREGVRRMDYDIEKIIAAQKARNRYEKTMWVFVADHGESLGDHSELLHGASFYNSVINVPLIIKAPGLTGNTGKNKALVSHVDILPTILDYVGATIPAGIDGVSLIPILQGTKSQVRSVTLSEGGVAQPKGEMPGAIIAPPWALLLQEIGCDAPPEQSPPRKPGEVARCLYNLDSDPQQSTLISRNHPKVITKLYALWKKIRSNRESIENTLLLDPAFVEELQRTGYDFKSPE
jgi:arylsulfatase A-like enzyme